jgi:hypothetical protein
VARLYIIQQNIHQDLQVDQKHLNQIMQTTINLVTENNNFSNWNYNNNNNNNNIYGNNGNNQNNNGNSIAPIVI